MSNVLVSEFTPDGTEVVSQITYEEYLLRLVTEEQAKRIQEDTARIIEMYEQMKLPDPTKKKGILPTIRHKNRGFMIFDEIGLDPGETKVSFNLQDLNTVPNRNGRSYLIKHITCYNVLSIKERKRLGL